MYTYSLVLALKSVTLETVITKSPSRRRWLSRLPLPLFATGFTKAQTAHPSSPANTRGVGTYNVRDFGAKGDGQALDTAAIQAAINQCSADGGGTVLLPQGVFLTGAIQLKSNVTLHLAGPSKLLGSADGKQYHAVDAIPLQGDSTLEDGNWALIYAVNAQNVRIEGAGLIDGQGIQFHSPSRGVLPPSGLGGLQRPYTLLFYRCEDLCLRDVRLINSAYHCVRVIQSTRVQIDGLYVHNRVNGNNDGFHFISARHVTVSNCMVESQDDACALFGSCQFVTVTNCSFSTRWSVFRFGGGVAENITVSNCLFYQVYGCPIKFHGGPGSRFENVSFSDLVLDDVTGPINISVGPASPQHPVSGSAAVARNISFANIHGTVTTNPGSLPDYPFGDHYRPGEGHSCITLNCVGDATLENISFSNVHLTFGGGGTAEDAARRDLPPIAGEYFVLGPMPAYGLYARNSRALTLQNVRFQVSQPDLRPAVIFDHIEDAAINGLNVQANSGSECLRFIDTKEVLLTATRLLTPAATFLRLEGVGNRAIVIDGGDITKAAAPLKFEMGASAAAVSLK